MIINENAKAYAEIDFIMKNMIPKEYVNKIPRFIFIYKSYKYFFKICALSSCIETKSSKRE